MDSTTQNFCLIKIGFWPRSVCLKSFRYSLWMGLDGNQPIFIAKKSQFRHWLHFPKKIINEFFPHYRWNYIFFFFWQKNRNLMHPSDSASQSSIRSFICFECENYNSICQIKKQNRFLFFIVRPIVKFNMHFIVTPFQSLPGFVLSLRVFLTDFWKWYCCKWSVPRANETFNQHKKKKTINKFDRIDSFFCEPPIDHILKPV